MTDFKALLILMTATVIFLLEGAFPHYPGRVRRVAHALPHVSTALLNALLTSLFFAKITAEVTGWAGVQGIGL